jgi:hypothetical protein
MNGSAFNLPSTVLKCGQNSITGKLMLEPELQRLNEFCQIGGKYNKESKRGAIIFHLIF